MNFLKKISILIALSFNGLLLTSNVLAETHFSDGRATAVLETGGGINITSNLNSLYQSPVAITGGEIKPNILLSSYGFITGYSGKGITTKISNSIYSDIVKSTEKGLFTGGLLIDNSTTKLDTNNYVPFKSSKELKFESIQSILKKTLSKFKPKIDKGTNYESIEAYFQPEGEVIGTVPLASLAKAMGYSHFNWIQVISDIPSGSDIYSGLGKLTSKDGEIITPNKKFFDPLTKGNYICHVNSVKELKDLTNYKYCGFLEADTLDFYLNIPGFGEPQNGYFNLLNRVLDNGYKLEFSDQPKLPRRKEGESISFTTILVGVKEGDLTYKTYEPINGFAFTWKSNFTCISQKCKKVIKSLASNLQSIPLNIEALGLTKNDFIQGINLIEDRLFLNEIPQDILRFISDHGAKLPHGLLYSVNANPKSNLKKVSSSTKTNASNTKLQFVVLDRD